MTESKLIFRSFSSSDGALDHYAATWTMKRPHRDHNLDLPKGVKISTKILPRDGKEHELAVTITNGALVVRVDGKVVLRDTVVPPAAPLALPAFTTRTR